MPTGCDRCPAGGYHGNGQCNSENHTPLFLREVATLQWQVTSFLTVCMLFLNTAVPPTDNLPSQKSTKG